MKYITYHISSGGVGWLGFYRVLGLVSPLSTSLYSRGCGYNIVCFTVILHGSQAPACINLPVSCGQVLISLVQSLFILSSQSISRCTFTLKRSFTSSLPLPAKNLWLLGFDFNHCWLKSPLWHPTMFFCCRAPYFIYLYSDTTGELWNLQNELIYLLRCEYSPIVRSTSSCNL